jgi:hypothetical protein
MAQRNFIVLRYQGQVPAMAGCEKCKCKFFTPATYSRDAVGAKEYLFSKFDHHNCEDHPPTGPPLLRDDCRVCSAVDQQRRF